MYSGGDRGHSEPGVSNLALFGSLHLTCVLICVFLHSCLFLSRLGSALCWSMFTPTATPSKKNKRLPWFGSSTQVQVKSNPEDNSGRVSDTK